MSQPLYIKIKDQENVAIAVKDIKAGTEAVSYTHLDVYKRQVYGLVEELVKYLPEENKKKF